MTPYIIGRRVGVAQPASDPLSRNIGPTSSLRAENSGNVGALRILGWGGGHVWRRGGSGMGSHTEIVGSGTGR